MTGMRQTWALHQNLPFNTKITIQRKKKQTVWKKATGDRIGNTADYKKPTEWELTLRTVLHYNAIGQKLTNIIHCGDMFICSDHSEAKIQHYNSNKSAN